MTGTKYLLDELITLYELEPDLREVVTEGRIDASVIRWFLRRAGCDTAVYAITDRVDVDSSEIRRRQQSVGNRGRVVTDALICDQTSPTAAASRITFVADVDTDRVNGTEPARVSCLLWTDYTSIEMYAYNRAALDKLLRVTLRAPEDVEADAVLKGIRQPLIDLFIARVVLQSASPPIGIVSGIESRFKIRNGRVSVDVRRLLLDSLNAAGGPKALGVDLEDLLARHALTLTQCADLDDRLVIHGHDFHRICCLYLKEVFPSLFKEDRSAYKSPGPFGNTLMTCVEMDDLRRENLFRDLLRRCSDREPPTADGSVA